MFKCPECGGSGEIRDLMWEMSDPCDCCKGTGKVGHDKAVTARVLGALNQLIKATRELRDAIAKKD